MGDGSGSFDRDKTRLCPSCRMAISVLATKCRFCGENVGRPRVEDRHFTVDDLGGASPQKHRVSDSVMDALEAFRKETLSDQKDAPKESDGGSGIEGAVPGSRNSGLTREIGESFTRIRTTAPSGRHGTRGRGKNVQISVAIVAALLLTLGGVFAVARVRAYMAQRDTPATVQYKNEARTILEQGGATLDALQTAVLALAHVDNDENRKIADIVRERLSEDVHALLNTKEYNEDNLRRASAIVDEAVGIDGTSEAVQALKAEVDEEEFAYRRMTIVKLDPAAKTATLKLIYPASPFEEHEIIVSKDEIVRERFKVKKITEDFVQFEDTKRQSQYGQNRFFKLTKTGAVI